MTNRIRSISLYANFPQNKWPDLWDRPILSAHGTQRDTASTAMSGQYYQREILFGLRGPGDAQLDVIVEHVVPSLW